MAHCTESKELWLSEVAVSTVHGRNWKKEVRPVIKYHCMRCRYTCSVQLIFLSLQWPGWHQGPSAGHLKHLLLSVGGSPLGCIIRFRYTIIDTVCQVVFLYYLWARLSIPHPVMVKLVCSLQGVWVLATCRSTFRSSCRRSRPTPRGSTSCSTPSRRSSPVTMAAPKPWQPYIHRWQIFGKSKWFGTTRSILIRSIPMRSILVCSIFAKSTCHEINSRMINSIFTPPPE